MNSNEHIWHIIGGVDEGVCAFRQDCRGTDRGRRRIQHKMNNNNTLPSASCQLLIKLYGHCTFSNGLQHVITQAEV